MNMTPFISIFPVLRIGLTDSCMLSKHFIAELYLHSFLDFSFLNFETEDHFIAQAGLELESLLPQPLG